MIYLKNHHFTIERFVLLKVALKRLFSKMETNTPSLKTEKLNLTRYVPALVTYLANKLSSGASACYRKHFGIGVTEWRLLALLKVETNITANRISEVIGLDKAAVSRALKFLKERGFVSFVKNAKDGRSTLIALTSSGEGIHNQIIKVALKREALLLKNFSEQELDTLIMLLTKMNDSIASVNAYDPEESN